MASSRMIALLGLLAVAGYQNRDKIADFLGRATNAGAGDRRPGGLQPTQDNDANPLGGMLGGLLGSDVAGTITGGLRDVVDSFSGSRQAETAKSWVETGPNRGVSPQDLEETLGEDTLRALAEQTGLSRQELLDRLSTVLPTAVDQLTPDGRLPMQAA